MGLAERRLDPNTRLTLDRVVPAPHVPHESHLAVGLDLTSRVRTRIAPGHTGVPASSVRSVRLHGHR